MSFLSDNYSMFPSSSTKPFVENSLNYKPIAADITCWDEIQYLAYSSWEMSY